MSIYEAAKQALDALFLIRDGATGLYGDDLARCNRALEILSAALADEQDWDELEALRASLREHMAEIHQLRAAGRQALDAFDSMYGRKPERVEEVITTLRAALEPVTICHEKEGGKLSPPSDHILDATKMMASVREDRTVEPVAYVTGYFDGRCVIKTVEPVLLPAGMALYRSLPTCQESRQVKPVGYFSINSYGNWEQNENNTGEPLYPAPPKRKPLTNQEIFREYATLWQFLQNEDHLLAQDILKFARAIERAHGIGGER